MEKKMRVKIMTMKLNCLKIIFRPRKSRKKKWNMINVKIMIINFLIKYLLNILLFFNYLIYIKKILINYLFLFYFYFIILI